jgi:hypothetical protein
LVESERALFSVIAARRKETGRTLTGGDEPTPLMPDEQAKIVKEIPRDTETIELFKKFAGTGALPSR